MTQGFVIYIYVHLYYCATRTLDCAIHDYGDCEFQRIIYELAPLKSPSARERDPSRV